MRSLSKTAAAVPVAAALVLSLFAAGASAQPGDPGTDDDATYWVYVANEASDAVSKVRFGPDGLVVEGTVEVGILSSDIDGAHGMAVSPDQLYWYVSVAHGSPFGQIWQYTAGSDRLVSKADVGLFPASMALTPDGTRLFVVNFNLHGNPVPSSVSVVFTRGMQELDQITTCVKPHGSAINHAGTRHYSGCVGGDQLVEISIEDLEVTRRLLLTPEEGRLLSPSDSVGPGTPPACRPSWVAVSPDDEFLYVTCNGRGEVLEIAASDLSINRRFATGRGPYNLAVSPDGRRVVATLKGEQSVAIIDLETGEQRRVATSEPVTHGVVISPDARYAFVSNEAIGSTPGTLDVIDLDSAELLASTCLELQAGGIAFWRMEGGESTTAALP